MKKFLRKVFLFVLKWVGILMLVSISWVVLFKWINPPVTPLMVIRYVQMEPDHRKLQYEWQSIDSMSQAVPLAAVASEDQRFPDHAGFDFEAIQKAIENNLSDNRTTMRGGSTISQQTAKNVFLWPGRSWVRKGLEVWFTSWIELIWGKKRILEVYLNVIEVGPGIYGVEAGGQAHFKTGADQLNRSQASLLAVVLPNPRQYNASAPTAYLQKRQQWVLRQMNNLGRNYLFPILIDPDHPVDPQK